MSESNPTRAINALLPERINVAEGVYVLPLTLAHYALLERIGSPFIVPSTNEKKFVLNLIPSFYVMTHTMQELRDVELATTPFEWAETIGAGVLSAISDACVKQISDTLSLVTNSKKKEIRKAETGG